MLFSSFSPRIGDLIVKTLIVKTLIVKTLIVNTFIVTTLIVKTLVFHLGAVVKMIPYINKTVDVILSEHIEARTVNVRDIIDELRGQVDDYTSILKPLFLWLLGDFM